MATTTLEQLDEFESAVISACFMEPAEVLPKVQRMLTPEMFGTVELRVIYLGMLALMAKGETVTPLSIAATAGASKDVIAWVLDAVPGTYGVEDHAKQVRRAHERRELVRLGAGLHALAQDATVEPSKLIADTARALSDLAASTGRSEGFVKIGADMGELGRELAEPPPKDGIVGIPTGWRDMDRLTGGALPGELWFFCAVPGGCKTLSLVNVARHNAVELGHTTAFVSAEMTRKAVERRLLCDLAGVDTYTMRTRRFDAKMGERLARQVAALRMAPLWIDETPAPTIGELLVRLEGLRARVPNIQLICVDYAQLIKGDAENRAEEIRAVAQELKSLAKRLKVPVFSAAQVNDKDIERGRKSTRPTLADIQGSSGIRQFADTIVLQHRPAMYGQQGPDIITMIMAKVRELDRAEVKLECQLPYQRLIDYRGIV